MTSSEIAQIALAAQIAVAALVLTSLQLRVLRRSPPRRRAYVVAWVVSIVIVGGLIWLSDMPVGNTGLARRVNSGLLVAVVGAVALAAGSWVSGRFPGDGKRVLRGLALFFVHLAITLAAALVVV